MGAKRSDVLVQYILDVRTVASHVRAQEGMQCCGIGYYALKFIAKLTANTKQLSVDLRRH